MNQPPPQGYGPPPQGYGGPPPQGWGQPPNNPYAAPGVPPGGDAFQLGQIAVEIKNQANASLAVGIIGLFCFGIILGPFAIYRGSKALRLIRENNIGHEHASKASIGRGIGIAVLVLWAIGLPLRFMMLSH